MYPINSFLVQLLKLQDLGKRMTEKWEHNNPRKPLVQRLEIALTYLAQVQELKLKYHS